MSDEMDEIWALYQDDGSQSLDAMEAALLALQDDPTQEGASEQIGALFRAVHTFKGNSRVLGLATVESRAHVSEDLIGLVRDEGVPLDDEIIDILLLAGDVLRDMLEETSATRADVDPAKSEDLMAQLQDKIARCTGEAPAEAEAQAEVAVVEDVPAEAEVVETQPEQEVAEAAAEPVEEVAEIAPEVAEESDEEPVEAVAEPASAADEWDELLEENEPVADAPVKATPQQAMPARRLVDDPSYRKIFEGMIDDCIGKLQAAMGGFAEDAEAAEKKVKRALGDLSHAAGQLGLDEWVSVLDAFARDGLAEGTPPEESVAQMILKIEELAVVDLGRGEVVDAFDGDGNFFDELQPSLVVLSTIGLDWSVGQAPEAGAIAAETDRVSSLARSKGFVRVADFAARLAQSETVADYRQTELRLYEELSAVESVLLQEAQGGKFSPTKLLRNWCADHAFDTLEAIDAALDGLKRDDERDAHYSSLKRQMRLVFHACSHHELETAGQLAMSLVDLFSRMETSGRAPDSILTHIARGYIDTLELVFDALAQGEIPDTQNLEILFEQASNAAFLSEGLMTATAIERRLSLPEEFHRVLSPESVRAASEAIEDGQNFYIISTDINEHVELAEKFLDWVASDHVTNITNVTVFRDGDTLFDFLVASPLDESEVVAGLSEMDPAGKLVSLKLALHDSAAESSGVAKEGSASEEETASTQAMAMPAEMLETLGEVAATQAMVHHMLSELGHGDIVGQISSLFQQSGGDIARARTDVLAMMSEFSAKFHEAVQVETQLVSQLTDLQEQTVAMRNRPVELLVRPLEALVASITRRNRTETKLTYTGGGIQIDVTLMDTLRKVLRAVITSRLSDTETAPNSMHVVFVRDEERVQVTLEDDVDNQGKRFLTDDAIEMVSAAGGTIREVDLPRSGVRYHISLPLSMVVLEGMAVGYEGVRYVIPVDSIKSIVQPDEGSVTSISAADGTKMLRVDEGALVPIYRLSGPVDGAQVGRQSAVGKRDIFVIVSTGNGQLAIPVDELQGQQLVLLRPLKGVLRHMRNLMGTALLAGGEVGMVLSTSSIGEDIDRAA